MIRRPPTPAHRARGLEPMTIVLLVSRLALAAVRLIAGIAKFCDLADSGEALRQFGLPGPIARIGGIALPPPPRARARTPRADA
jgi:uncharacterized membrane protein YphA (DoxX/SURF4 family)